MLVSEKIRFIRDSLGYTQQDFAYLLETTRPVIRDYESGKTPVKKDFLDKLGILMNIPVEVFMDTDIELEFVKRPPEDLLTLLSNKSYLNSFEIFITNLESEIKDLEEIQTEENALKIEKNKKTLSEAVLRNNILFNQTKDLYEKVLKESGNELHENWDETFRYTHFYNLVSYFNHKRPKVSFQAKHNSDKLPGEMIAKDTSVRSKIITKQPLETIIGEMQEKIIAQEAAIKILFLEIIQLKHDNSKDPNSSIGKISLELEKMTQQEAARLLDVLRKESSSPGS